MASSVAYNMDCMEAMKTFPDKFFDLAVVDPPYGDGNPDNSSGGGGTASRNTTSVHYQRKNVRQPDGSWGYANWRHVGGEVCKKIIAWDTAPGEEYFKELFRVSRNQIIWGGNYFALPPTRCFLVWRKLTISEKFTMAMAEYAWTSFNSNAKVFEHVPQDNTGQRFHPTQKPVALYAWIFSKYAKPGYKILDTHLGSGSSRIAAYDAGLDFWGYEIDKEYFDKQEERFAAHSTQVSFFDSLEGGDPDA